MSSRFLCFPPVPGVVRAECLRASGQREILPRTAALRRKGILVPNSFAKARLWLAFTSERRKSLPSSKRCFSHPQKGVSPILKKASPPPRCSCRASVTIGKQGLL